MCERAGARSPQVGLSPWCRADSSAGPGSRRRRRRSRIPIARRYAEARDAPLFMEISCAPKHRVILPVWRARSPTERYSRRLKVGRARDRRRPGGTVARAADSVRYGEPAGTFPRKEGKDGKGIDPTAVSRLEKEWEREREIERKSIVLLRFSFFEKYHSGPLVLRVAFRRGASRRPLRFGLSVREGRRGASGFAPRVLHFCSF